MLRILTPTTTSNFKAAVALSDAELCSRAPSVYSPRPMTGLSGRYTFVPTAGIIQSLRERDWVAVAAEQQRVRLEARRGFQKHLIRFRRREQMETLDEWNPELVLTNSHDASCCYVLQVGIYRRICSNGLVVSDESFEAIRFRHSRLTTDAIVLASFEVLTFIPKLGGTVARFRSRQLTSGQATDFAAQALLLRYGSLEEAPVEPASLLAVRRPEDAAADLWATFNRVQENLIRGGITDGRVDRRGHMRSVRCLRGIDSRVSLNKGLWAIAEGLSSASN